MNEELRERIKTVIDTEPVALFMKGTPTFVMCGNSERALQALHAAGAPVTAVDILPDPEIRLELSALDIAAKKRRALAALRKRCPGNVITGRAGSLTATFVCTTAASAQDRPEKIDNNAPENFMTCAE